MRFIKLVEEYGQEVNKQISIVEDGSKLSVNINQEGMLAIQDRFHHSGKHYGENGLEYAYANMARGDYNLLWEVITMLDYEISAGDKGSLYDFKHRNHKLVEGIMEAMDEFVEEVMDIEGDKG